MPNKKLRKSPLTYVLAQVRISQIESIADYVPKIQEVVRKDFPIYQEVNIQTIEIKDKTDSNIRTSLQWHFKDKESWTGIILDKQTITIHTSKYNGFDELNSKIENILDKFNKILDVSLSVRIGLRYINIIQSDIKEYMQPSLLGFYEKEDDNFLTSVDTTRKTEDGFIKIRAIHPKNVAFIHPGKMVPPDLVSSADQLSFKHYKDINDEYVILDIDNFYQKQLDFDVAKTTKVFSTLHKKIYETFCLAVTKKALKAWE